MTLTLRVSTTILLGFLSVSSVCWAQRKNKPPDVKQSQKPVGTEGTLVKKPPVITDDGISLLAARPPAQSAETSKVEAAADPAARESAGAPQDSEKMKAEIAALELQIQEKQRRIEFLMQMFVIDEQSFLNDPTRQSGDEELRAKRRFEQEELRREVTEIARLRTRLGLMATPGGEKAAPAK